jgi:aerobic carbon-monoxide dehydrogenase medium subunit
MKPAAFVYHSPTTISEAVSLLAELGESGRPLAGGQSLVPLMNFRLANPEHLVDINDLTELSYVRRDGDWLAVGAMTRQSQLERSPEAAGSVPLLTEAVRLVAHPPIRHRGTVGGSIAHADPAAELPTVALAMDAEMVIASVGGERVQRAAEFFKGPYETDLQPGELLTEVRLHIPAAGVGTAFLEFTRTHANFAVVGVAALARLDGGVIREASIALCGVGGVPVRASAAEGLLVGQALSADLISAAADAASEGLKPASDVHGSAGYRVKIARVYVRRALELALERARGAAA